MRLQDRLAITVTTVTASALVASFVAVYLFVQQDETKALDEALLLQARSAADLAYAKNPARPAADDGFVHVPEGSMPETRYAAVYDSEGDLVSATRSFGGAPPAYAALGAGPTLEVDGSKVDLSVTGGDLRGVVVPLGDQGHRLLLAATRHEITRDERFLWRTLSLLFVAATLLITLVARWLGSRLARDVEAIAAVAQRVAQGDLDARVGRSAVQGSSETRALAADLDHMITQLSSLVSAQRTFISHAAHELRSPLTSIRGELQLALRRPREAAEYKAAITEVLEEVESLGRLAEDLLTLARVQAGSDSARECRAEEVVADALRMARGRAELRRVQLAARLAEEAGAVTVRGTRGEIGRALRNLVDNAVAHSPPGSSVEVEVLRAGDRLRFVVRDQGPGVPPNDQPHIFSPFFRGAKEAGSEETGAGLGLAIARGIARGHGGEVSYASGPEPGACFVLELPEATPGAGERDRDRGGRAAPQATAGDAAEVGLGAPRT